MHTINDNKEDNSVNLRDLLFKYLIHWKWFLLSVVAFFALSKLYLRYSIPIYKSTTTVLIRDDKAGNIASELSAIQDIGLFSGPKNQMEDEVEILKSRKLTEKTVKEGDFNIKYIEEGRIKSSDAYGANPVKILFDNKEKIE